MWSSALKTHVLSAVQVIGQTADLIDLQKILKCSKNRLSDREQQNMTVGNGLAVTWHTYSSIGAGLHSHAFDPCTTYCSSCTRPVIW